MELYLKSNEAIYENRSITLYKRYREPVYEAQPEIREHRQRIYYMGSYALATRVTDICPSSTASPSSTEARRREGLAIFPYGHDKSVEGQVGVTEGKA